MADKIQIILYRIFQVLISVFFAVVCVSQILGVFGLYQATLVFVLSIVLFGAVLFFWWKATPLEPQEDAGTSDRKRIELAGYLGGVILLTLLLGALSRWPAFALPWDAGEYHYTKAAELFRTGSANDFTISYGDYPFGYESILSFGLLLAKDLAIYGLLHVFIALLFVLALWALAKKYSSLPVGLLFFIIIFLCLSGLIPFFNPWNSLYLTIFTVGKNDLMLAAATIAAIAFSRFGLDKTKSHDLMGLSLATAIGMSVKPNSTLIFLLLWADVLVFEWRQKTTVKTLFMKLLSYGVICLTGVIWLFRNLIGFSAFFDPNSYRIVSWSIWSNLLNPDFYLHIPKSLLLVAAVLVLSIGLSFLKLFRKFLWRESLLFAVLLLSFMITPASAAQNDPSQVAWRFGTALLVQEFCLLLLIADKLLVAMLKWVIERKFAVYAASAVILLVAAGFFVWQADLLRAVPGNAWPLYRSYKDNDAPYLSVFDYIDENIHDAVIWVEGSQSHYAYDPDFTNSVTRSEPADYIVAVNRTIDDLWITEDEWEVLYQDRYGTIYQRKGE